MATGIIIPSLRLLRSPKGISYQRRQTLLRMFKGIVNCRQYCFGAGAATSSSDFGQLKLTGYAKGDDFSGRNYKVRYRHSSKAQDYAENAYVERALGPSMPVMSPHNKKWMTKKQKIKKKNRPMKVIEYEEVKDSTLNAIIQAFPKLEEIDRDDLRVVIAHSVPYGFTPKKVAKVLSKYPDFLQDHTSMLPDSAHAWRQLELPLQDKIRLFAEHPQLMLLRRENLLEVIQALGALLTNKEIMLFIKNNPLQLEAHTGALMEKVSALWKYYSHSPKSICQSSSCHHDLKHIKLRHEFLIRGGFYKRIRFHKFKKMQAEEERRNTRIQRDKYFPPVTVVCSNDAKYLSICTKNQLSLSELIVFEDLFTQELDRQEELDDLDGESVDDVEEDDIDEDDESMYEGEERLRANYFHPAYYKNMNSFDLFGDIETVDFFY